MNPLDELFKYYTFIQMVLGVLAAVHVFYRPRSLWLIVIAGSIFGQGPRFVGYQFFDEYIVWCVIVGALARIVVSNVRLSSTAVETEQRAFFYIWVAYMIVESVIGIFVNDDVRIVRWVLFYTSIGLLAFITYNYGNAFAFPSFRKTARLVIASGILYHVGYIAIGMIYKAILGKQGHFSSQFLTTGIVWAGTAAAVVPVILAIPAAVMTIHENDSFWKNVACWILLALIMVSGHFYDSRMVFIVLVACFVTSLPKFKIKYVAVFMAVFCITFVAFSGSDDDNFQRSYSFFSKLYEGATTLFHSDDSIDKGEGGEKGDVNRRLQFEAALLRVTDNPATFFFGDGVYSHRTTIIPYVDKLYSIYLPDDNFVQPSGWDEVSEGQYHSDNKGSFDIFRTTGFSALLIDSGTVGMVLFVLCFLYCGAIVRRQKSRYRLMLLSMLMLNFWWLFVNNVVDAFIMYLLIMPKGLLEHWSSETVGPAETAKATTAARELAPQSA